MKYLILIALFSFFGAQGAVAQDCGELTPSKSRVRIPWDLLDKAKSIKSACQMAEGDDYFNVHIEYQGFDDKEYRIIGQLLDGNRRKVVGCPPLTQKLEEGSSSADLAFRFETGTTKVNNPYVEVRYLRVSIVDNEGLFSDIDLGGLDLGGISFTGTSAEYKVDHQFRIGIGSDGTSNVTVSVSLTPVGRAATIKQ